MDRLLTLNIMRMFFCFFFGGWSRYIHLSVAFIQMMKSVTPATTMAGLAIIGKMPDSSTEVLTVLLICLGTMIAAYGEVESHSLCHCVFCFLMVPALHVTQCLHHISAVFNSALPEGLRSLCGLR